jgi:hypothetical protein
LMAMHQAELTTFKDIGFRLVRVDTTKDACTECKKIAEKVFTIEEAMKGNVLPHRACKHDVKGRFRPLPLPVPGRIRLMTKPEG